LSFHQNSLESFQGKEEPKFHFEVRLQNSANSDDTISGSKVQDPEEAVGCSSVVKVNEDHPGDNVISYGNLIKGKAVRRVSRAVQCVAASAAEPQYECEQCHKVFPKR